MSMPKTAVDEQHFTPRSEHEVRSTRQPDTMQSVAVTQPMQTTPHQHLRSGPFGTDFGHDPATDIGRHMVSHRDSPKVVKEATK